MVEILEELERILNEAKGKLATASELAVLEDLKIRYLGRKGELTKLLRRIGQIPRDERPAAGKAANEAREELENLLREKLDFLKRAEREQFLKGAAIDVTMPGRRPYLGRIHPVTLTLRKIKEVFIGLGFEVVEGPEVETDYYNFEALNIPKDHPSREMWDSFYLEENLLLRSHTSPVQVRVMEKRLPPIRIIVPGKCYRRDAVDATHSWMFHQVEGLLVDEGVTFADLKGVLEVFAREVFGAERKTKFIPSYFPFTEPSAEMAIDCMVCNGKGCRVCKQSGWLEILGSGMVHPRVLERVSYDSEKYTGFAFGMGVERIAMLKYGIDDIRLFFENDLRFLRQF